MKKRKASAIRHIGVALVDAARAMFRYETPTTAAAISYFSLFALFPATLVMVALVDAFLGWLDLHETVLERIVDLFPASRSFLAANLSEITDLSAPLVASCMIVVLWSSTWVFMFVENALNRAWGVQKQRTFWQSRLRSIALLALGGVLLLASTGITWVVSLARSRANARLPAFAKDEILDLLWSTILLSAGFLIAILVFLLVYKLMPDRKVLWGEAFSGAIAAASLWEFASYIFAKLIPFFDYAKVYGTMGAVIAILIWVYTSTFIMLFGGNFSAQLHRPWQEHLFSGVSDLPIEDEAVRRLQSLSRHR